MMESNTTTTIRLKPRWWQFIRRFRAWLEDRRLIGQTIILNDVEYTIEDYRRSTGVVTLDRDATASDGDAILFVPPKAEGETLL